MTAEQLYETLRKIQEPMGYFFNREREMVFDLLNGLLLNRERYGYMCCPCRLASGNREWDRDIICPCAYREEDVREYGSCYCGLYVSPSLKEDPTRSVFVPERRPPEKIRF
jgi:ferredoxin-thioredoxin reductase catalytic subunit